MYQFKSGTSRPTGGLRPPCKGGGHRPPERKPPLTLGIHGYVGARPKRAKRARAGVNATKIGGDAINRSSLREAFTEPAKVSHEVAFYVSIQIMHWWLCWCCYRRYAIPKPSTVSHKMAFCVSIQIMHWWLCFVVADVVVVGVLKSDIELSYWQVVVFWLKMLKKYWFSFSENQYLFIFRWWYWIWKTAENFLIFF